MIKLVEFLICLKVLSRENQVQEMKSIDSKEEYL